MMMLSTNTIDSLIYLPALGLGFLVWLAVNRKLWVSSHQILKVFPSPGIQGFLFLFFCYALSISIVFEITQSPLQQQLYTFAVNCLCVGVAFFLWKEKRLAFPWFPHSFLKQFFVSLLHFVTLYPLILVAFTLNSQWIESHHPMVEFLMNASLAPWTFTLFCLGTAVIVPIFEEILYRGFLQSGLQKYLGLVPALVIQSLLFAFMHPLHTVAPIFIFAVALTLVSVWSRSLFPAICMHVLFNSLTCLELSVVKFGNWWVL